MYCNARAVWIGTTTLAAAVLSACLIPSCRQQPPLGDTDAPPDTGVGVGDTSTCGSDTGTEALDLFSDLIFNTEGEPDGVPSGFSIKMHWSPCAGGCAAYNVTMFGDGRISYEGLSFVDVPGPMEGLVSRGVVLDAIQSLHVAEFQSFRRDYRSEKFCADIADGQGSILTTVTVGTDSHRVEFYEGCRFCRAQVLSDLLHHLDDIMGARQWAGDGCGDSACEARDTATDTDLPPDTDLGPRP